MTMTVEFEFEFTQRDMPAVALLAGMSLDEREDYSRRLYAATLERAATDAQAHARATTDRVCRELGIDPWEVVHRPARRERIQRLLDYNAQIRADLARVRRANRPRDKFGRWTR
jgi:hypothetical protein